MSCNLIRVNLVGWVRQLLHWKLSLQFKDRRWTGAISVGPSMCSMNFFCLMSPRISKLDDIQAATFIFLLFIQDVMFWRSNRKQEQSVQLLHSISITLLLLWLHWAFRPDSFTDASLPACLLADSQRACMLASLFPEGLPFLLFLISSWSCYFILNIHLVSCKHAYLSVQAKKSGMGFQHILVYLIHSSAENKIDKLWFSMSSCAGPCLCGSVSH